DHVDDMVQVDTDALCAAIKDVFQDTRSVLEPAGALAVAGAKRYAAAKGWRGKTLVAITSGANMNFDRLPFVAERADVGEARVATCAVTSPVERCSLMRLCEAVGSRSVTEFNYRISDPRQAHVFVGLQIESLTEADQLADGFRQRGFAVDNLTDNELAKTHMR